MSDSIKEQLSAYLDGELSREEVALLAKRVGRDVDLGASLGRYALISESLKGDRPTAVSTRFAANVMTALDAEPAVAASRPSLSTSPWVRRMRPVAGLAVAASVAAVAILSIQRPLVGPAVVADNDATPVSLEAVASDPEPSYTVPTTAQTSAFVPAARLTNYVVAHSEYSSPLGRRTVLSGVLSEGDDAPIEDEQDPTDTSPVSEAQVTTPR